MTSKLRRWFPLVVPVATTLYCLVCMSVCSLSSSFVAQNRFVRMSSSFSFVDIGANLLDDRYNGEYYGKVRHKPDITRVLQRASQYHVKHVIVTAGTLRESRRALSMVRDYNQQRRNHDTDIPSLPHLSCTIGIHPTRCQQEFIDNLSSRKEQDTSTNSDACNTDEDVLQELLALAVDGQQDGSVVAIGEIGLDYDRLEFCSKEVQQHYLKRQLQVLQATQLPLFLHNRNCSSDLYDILESSIDRPWRGVVHSFDDTIELARKFMNKGLYIGLNGCSLKTTDNLRTVAQLPLDKILLETDSPYCEVRKTHAGYPYLEQADRQLKEETNKDEELPIFFEAKADKKYEEGKCVKGRQEPCHIVQVARIVAACRKESLGDLAEAVYKNSLQLYGWDS